MDVTHLALQVREGEGVVIRVPPSTEPTDVLVERSASVRRSDDRFVFSGPREVVFLRQKLIEKAGGWSRAVALATAKRGNPDARNRLP